jgi:hypothetical protein
MAGTVVTPVDALVRFYHYTAHFPDDYDIDGVTVTALLTTSGASDVAALYATPPFNPASCKTRRPSVYVEATIGNPR